MERYTIITGASSGIGKELAFVFAQNGHNLILLARRESILQNLSRKLEQSCNVSVKYYICDLTSRKNLEHVIEDINTNYTIEVLINNAGIGDFRLFADSDILKNDYLVDLNIKSILFITHRLLSNIANSESGKILNVASFAAYIPGPYMAVYTASKNFLLHFSLALSTELKQMKIQVSVLSPGDVPTGFQEKAGLEGFHPQGALSAEELAKYTYDEFINKGVVEIIPPKAKEAIRQLNSGRERGILGSNLLFLRKRLATTLSKVKRK